jgi:hypothetical protein
MRWESGQLIHPRKSGLWEKKRKDQKLFIATRVKYENMGQSSEW